MSTLTAPRTAAPRRPALSRDVAMRLAAVEYDRVLQLLTTLTPTDWSRPTECPGWDVRAMVGHMLGMAEMSASMLEQVRQLYGAKRAGGVVIDALTALQVEKHKGDTPELLVRSFTAIAPKAAAGRRRVPRFVRNRRMPEPQAVGGIDEGWTLGYLIDVILTRDPWMHRIDLCRAVGVTPMLTSDHDGVLVDDVVREWALRHGQACRLELDGPAGGSWGFGAGGPLVALEATEFCRAVSGRGEGTGLLSQQVPF